MYKRQIGAYPEGKDYRAKTWQHSIPLFWVGQMPTASELGRLYSCLLYTSLPMR